MTASISITSSGAPERITEVTSTVEGPSARTSSAAARTSSSAEAPLSASLSVMKPSSNWLGVSTSATGITVERYFGGIAGFTKQPDVALPMTGSQVYVASGLAALTRATASTITSAISGEPW